MIVLSPSDGILMKLNVAGKRGRAYLDDGITYIGSGAIDKLARSENGNSAAVGCPQPGRSKEAAGPDVSEKSFVNWIPPKKGKRTEIRSQKSENHKSYIVNRQSEIKNRKRL